MNRCRWSIAPFAAIALLALLVLPGCEEKGGKSAGRAQVSPDEINKEKGEKFLAENAKKPGVKTTDDGLQYLVLKEGTGKTPKLDDTVVVNYRGTTIDGKVFDSSADRKKPATVKVKDVLAGWREVLQLMKEGSKWRVFIPSQLAYGKRGLRYKLGSNETLIYDIELLKVK
jgi:FKBP-type peptidyl-prolyl cis-trans isomerase FklB